MTTLKIRRKAETQKSYSNSTIFQKLMVDDVRNKILHHPLSSDLSSGLRYYDSVRKHRCAVTMFGSTSVLDYYNLVSGGALSQCAVFAIGVSAYINASIIIQL